MTAFDPARFIVYPRSFGAIRATPTQRLMAALTAAGCLLVLLTAAWLNPSPVGNGTHQQLGLAACQFKERTGLPCFSCGMTTSFSFFAHGNILASFYVQPLGCMLAFLAAVTVWIGFYCAISGKTTWRLTRFLNLQRFALPMIVFAILAWAWKICLTLKGWDGWR